MSKFSKMTPGRPSQSPDAKAKLLESLRDAAPQEKLERVNFEVPASKKTKLKIIAAKKGMTVKEFLTGYIDSFPDE
ncbi:hypothetical protein AHiyo1_50850 [Arthrobacter sp. Hiyo1]|uniref:hypothetical protein n=1 Tax=Arthrobacter sp. Hiyo1 TaxID=1588020 RepID=UPI0006A35647|nr:hypothetical protein [Arthrobacter sp. Hiyo1]GAP61385.1 hypothetical protein AHiyo1_50850 [Arthrobacter sp. Hiyo1]